MQSLGKIASLLQTKVGDLLPRNKLARGVSVLSGGNAIGQIITVLAAPLLTRLYTPGEFGVAALYISITLVLGVVLSLKYEVAIALPESDKEALVLVKLCLCIVVLMAVIFTCITLIYKDSVAALFKTPELANHLLFLPISVLLLGSFDVFKSWCIRKREFVSVGKARVSQVVSSVLVQLAGAPLGSISLILGQLANQGAGSIRLGKITLGQSKFENYPLSDLWRLLVRYKKFPLVTTWALLLNRVGHSLPTFFLAFYFGSTVAGLYALATRVLKSPALVFTGSINSVFLSTAARMRHSGDLSELTRKTHELLAAVFMPPIVLASLLSPQLFGIVFGSEWASAGDYSQWILLTIYWTFAASPLTSLFSILEKQEYDLYFQMQLITLTVAGLVLGGYIGSPLTSIAIFSLTASAHYLIFLFWLFRHLKIGVLVLTMQIVRAAIVSLAVVSPLLLFSFFNPERTEIYWLCVAVSLLIFGLWIIIVYRYKYDSSDSSVVGK